MDFKIVDGFRIRECEGLRGRDAERTDGFKHVFSSDVNTWNRFGGIRIFVEVSEAC